MRALILGILIAQQQATTPADSNAVRTLLRAGIEALHPARSPGFHPLVPRRYLEQMELWSMPDEATRAAILFDSIQTLATGRISFDWRAQRAANALGGTGDTLAALETLDRIPEASRQDAMSLASLLLRGYAQPSVLTGWLDSRIISGWPRAQTAYRRHREVLARGDTAAARHLLLEAIGHAGDSQRGRRTSWHWLIEAKALGETVTTDAIVSLATAGEDPRLHWAIRHDVASTLTRGGHREQALALIDSLGVEALHAPESSRSTRLAQLKLLRGGADSVDGRRQLDSTIASRPAASPDILSTATLLDRRALSTIASGDSAVRTDALVLLFQRLGDEARNPSVYQRWPLRRDSLASFIPHTVQATAAATASRSSIERDSIRHVAVSALVPIDLATASRLADSIETRRFRDRARAAVLVQRATFDADGAATAADSLSDTIARDAVFSELAVRASAAGRLSLAARLAELTGPGEPRVRAYLASATARFRGGQVDDARRDVITMLTTLSPRWQCRFPCPAPDPAAADPERIGEAVHLALELGLDSALVDWARRQPDAGSQASAFVAIVEGMTRRLLGRYPFYPRQ